MLKVFFFTSITLVSIKNEKKKKNIGNKIGYHYGSFELGLDACKILLDNTFKAFLFWTTLLGIFGFKVCENCYFCHCGLRCPSLDHRISV
jgi:hypothetical protein